MSRALHFDSMEDFEKHRAKMPVNMKSPETFAAMGAKELGCKQIALAVPACPDNCPVCGAKPGQEHTCPPWTCSKCGQKNAGWANCCGGCQKISDDLRRETQAVIDEGLEKCDTLLKQINLTMRPSTDEAKLNKLEKARLRYLQALKMPGLRVHAVTLKIADDCRLTVDFTYLDPDGRMVFEDVKGFQREDALIKMKVAARQFPEFRFVIVKKDKTGCGRWQVQEVKP